jgi:hypothetical protein
MLTLSFGQSPLFEDGTHSPPLNNMNDHCSPAKAGEISGFGRCLASII